MSKKTKNKKEKRRQGIYWIHTIPNDKFKPHLPAGCVFITGQLESGTDSGYLHWQFISVWASKQSLNGIRDVFGPFFAELSRSSAAESYCSKSATAVAGTQFEFGVRPFKRNSSQDWERIWSSAIDGKFDDIPAQVRVCHFSTLRAIRSEYAKPLACMRKVQVYWGLTGVGKTKLAYEEAGLGCYFKNPRTKFWDGYRGEQNVIIDEFRGAIDVANLLLWFDRYPVRVEIKGSSVPMCVSNIWVTSNLHPKDWFPDLDKESYDALLRRITIKEIVQFFPNKD